MQRLTLRNLLAPGLLAAVLLLSRPAFGQGPQNTLQTMYSTISYPDGDGLLDLGRRINKDSYGLVRDREKAAGMVREDVDRIVFRVKALLDMHPPDFRFDVVVFRTYGELKEAYRGLGMTGKAPVAFYRQKSHTIYLSLDKLTAGILAHEVAHAVINAFFAAPPPAQVQEILAQYVDRHLWD